MAVSDWSITPASNTFLATFNLQEGSTLVGDFNGITRQIMADVKAFSLTVPAAADYVTKSGGAFTTNPIYTGRGGYLHHNSATLTGGRVFIQASGAGTPSGIAAGDVILEY
jgi:hypothetical protein